MGFDYGREVPIDRLFLGPVPALMNRKNGNILVKTHDDHPKGRGIVICRLPEG